MAANPQESTKAIRRTKGRGGAHIYINRDVLEKSLEFAGLPLDCNNLHVKAHAAKDGKRAKIMLYLFCK